MAKEWVLNQAMNRWGLNKKSSVGPVSDLIRNCSPRTLEEWQAYYFEHAYPMEHLEELGRKLYVKVSEVVQHEVAEVTEKDCTDYMKDVVVRRTFEGYQTEMQTIYGQLEKELGVPVLPSPDEWDRLYNVDFHIEIDGKTIGIQIKPVSFDFTFENHKWKAIHEATRLKFRAKFGGDVFMVFSSRVGDRKIIKNDDVIGQIRDEIRRLKSS